MTCVWHFLPLLTVATLLLKFYSVSMRLWCACVLIFRRRKGEKLFLVAFYECTEDYELENLEQDRLYCSKEKWVGDTPKCMPINDEGEDEDDEDEENGEGE